MDELLSVDAGSWRAELPQIEEHFAGIGDTLPATLADELAELEKRLAAASALRRLLIRVAEHQLGPRRADLVTGRAPPAVRVRREHDRHRDRDRDARPARRSSHWSFHTGSKPPSLMRPPDGDGDVGADPAERDHPRQDLQAPRCRRSVGRGRGAASELAQHHREGRAAQRDRSDHQRRGGDPRRAGTRGARRRRSWGRGWGSRRPRSGRRPRTRTGGGPRRGSARAAAAASSRGPAHPQPVRREGDEGPADRRRAAASPATSRRSMATRTIPTAARVRGRIRTVSERRCRARCSRCRVPRSRGRGPRPAR